MSSPIGNEPRDRAVAEIDEVAGKPLDFVRREPLSSMFKVVREPPPMFDAALTSPGALRAVTGSVGVAPRNLKLAATGLTLDLAELVINREQEIEACGDTSVQRGFEEVYRYLLDGEYLRKLREG